LTALHIQRVARREPLVEFQFTSMTNSSDHILASDASVLAAAFDIGRRPSCTHPEGQFTVGGSTYTFVDLFAMIHRPSEQGTEVILQYNTFADTSEICLDPRTACYWRK